MTRTLLSIIATVLTFVTTACATPPSSSNTEPPTMNHQRPRQLGFTFGTLPAGPLNAITDVAGVTVGHTTLIEGDAIRTGVTAILPHQGNLYREKTPAAVFVGNGYGKLAGSTQVQELGTLETPVILTNTLSVAAGIEGAIRYSLGHPDNQGLRSINALVGETNDSYLNDIRALAVRPQHVIDAITSAADGPVAEGSVGAGTGTTSFGYKGGIGTASRTLPAERGGYTLGVLVQTNFGGDLTISGLPVGRALKEPPKTTDDGSCMIVIATDAPLSPRNLKRLAARAMLGLAPTGSYISNGSGDYAIAFSTAYRIRESGLHEEPVALLANRAMSPLFQASVEATEEAVINALFAATTITGRDGNTRHAIPVDRVLDIARHHRVID
ncbi:DmpA family aminopeptidase [Mucisphaera calidilacus]|uniref:Peptidase family S58 n=1 Tax=Mucisphaera calidilacus TaxID=2527982 RepID=A0A518BV02_9BACT|nr:P1 family peptidase [Mucisphaera calidilacus]QDU70812.1 Peptidase family S58 [Mucisphaera calidilacus]